MEQHSEGSLRTALHSDQDHEQWASSKELVVKVTELNAELGRMKAVIGRLEAERTSQDVWLKERWRFTSSMSFNDECGLKTNSIPDMYSQKVWWFDVPHLNS